MIAAEELTIPQGVRDGQSEAVGEALSLYLHEIGRVSLLSANAEVQLAKAIEAGALAAKRLERGEALSQSEARSLEATALSGRVARARLIEGNLRLVVSVARRYANRGVPLGDLIQEGNTGLMRAVEKFDYRRGFKFSTYATWWIRQAVTRALSDQARTIRVPVHMVENVNKYARVTSGLLQQLGRDPTVEEIGQAMEVSADQVREIGRLLSQPLSLDSAVGDDGESVLSELIRDENSLDMDQAAARAMLRLQLSAVLSSLSARERRVVELRFGLDGDRVCTLTEIGDELGITRERVRQIEARALRKLRQPMRSFRLRGYAE